jgi:hypothetical protein
LTDFVEQEYLNELTDELEFYVDELETRLELYDQDQVGESQVEKVAEQANQTYEELDEILDEVREQLSERDVVDTLGDLLEEHGISGQEFLMGRDPITASGDSPEKAVFEDLKETEGPDRASAYEAIRRYNSLRSTARAEYGLDLPETHKTIDPKHREIVEIMTEEGIDAAEAKKRLGEEENFPWEEENQ